MRRIVLGLIAVMTLSTSAPANEPLSDYQIFHMIVGTWIVTHDDPDKVGDSRIIKLENLAQETFNADGTGSVVIYSDATCTNVRKSTKFQWSIDKGVMISLIDGKYGSRDEVLDIDTNAFTIRLTDSSFPEVLSAGLLQHRVRGTVCSTPISKW